MRMRIISMLCLAALMAAPVLFPRPKEITASGCPKHYAVLEAAQLTSLIVKVGFSKAQAEYIVARNLTPKQAAAKYPDVKITRPPLQTAGQFKPRKGSSCCNTPYVCQCGCCTADCSMPWQCWFNGGCIPSK